MAEGCNWDTLVASDGLSMRMAVVVVLVVEYCGLASAAKSAAVEDGVRRLVTSVGD